MKSLAIALIILLVSGVLTNAQANISSCPILSVAGPAGLAAPGESIKFDAELKGAITSNLQYKWRIDKGGILYGQGTANLTVVFRTWAEAPITATLEVVGLPAGCPNVASATHAMAIDPGPILVVEGKTPVSKIDKRRLNQLLTELNKHPYAIAYIIEYFPPKISRRVIAKKLGLIEDYVFETRGLESERLKIVTARLSDVLTKYYIIPPSATHPAP